MNALGTTMDLFATFMLLQGWPSKDRILDSYDLSPTLFSKKSESETRCSTTERNSVRVAYKAHYITKGGYFPDSA